MTDAEVIVSSWTDPERFALIFERHFDAIYRYLRRRVGQELADDLAAETFVAAFGARRQYRPCAEDARPWLYGIATNLLKRHQRSEIRRLHAYARTGKDPDADVDEQAVVQRLDAAAVAAPVAAALAAL